MGAARSLPLPAAWAGESWATGEGWRSRVAKTFGRQAPQRGERLPRLPPGGTHHDLVAVTHAESGHGVHAARAHRAAMSAQVGDGYLGVEAGHGAHQQRGRPRVQPQRVAHG